MLRERRRPKHHENEPRQIKNTANNALLQS